MSIPAKNLRIGAAVVVVLGTIAWLAMSGIDSSKTYYVTIPELKAKIDAGSSAFGKDVYSTKMRVDGFVVPGSIVHSGPHATFVMNEFESHSPKAPQGRKITVEYKGTEPPPDTFKDDSQALAEGTYGKDGVFHATMLQAKCASKYAPTEPGATPGQQQAAPPANQSAQK
jgi:cytochrome c-type biogenesis protein CcmE